MRLRLTQEKAAELAGVSRVTIAKWELGTLNSPESATFRDNIYNYCKALAKRAKREGMNPDDFTDRVLCPDLYETQEVA